MDAWRIESAELKLQGAMVATYQVGYRIALICGSAGALAVAARASWHWSYLVMAMLGGIGILTTLFIPEPQPGAAKESVQRETRVIEWLESRAHWPRPLLSAGEWFLGAVVCPLLDFFGRYRVGVAIVLLLFIGSYRLTEFTMGSMINSFYIDQGYTLDQIATVVKIYGLSMAMVGVFIAGILVAKIGLPRSLVLGSVLVMLSNTGFAILAKAHTPTLLGLGFVNGLDNLALAVHGVALITFLSGLTSPKYTATQYALFSSLYALPGKILEGLSGFVVDHIGYPAFFVYTASLSLPGLILLFFVARRDMPGAAAARDGSQDAGREPPLEERDARRS
jgi:MFS transporter, PAT family, beta-lactamase induction signal transducer AmpG